jgi:hypothetical protein
MIIERRPHLLRELRENRLYGGDGFGIEFFILAGLQSLGRLEIHSGGIGYSLCQIVPADSDIRGSWPKSPFSIIFRLLGRSRIQHATVLILDLTVGRVIN